MFSLSVLLVFGVILNANGHLLMKMLHNLHQKYHPNDGHHSGIFAHSGPGRYPPFGPQSQFGPQYGPEPQFGPEYEPYGPPPFGFPPHHAPHQHSPHYHNCQNEPCQFPYPNNGKCKMQYSMTLSFERHINIEKKNRIP